MIFRICLSLMLTVSVVALAGGAPSDAGTTGLWLGETPPGPAPVLFAPGLVSTGLYERDTAVTPDGKEFYFSVMGTGYAVIVFCRQENGRWTTPEIAPFCRDTPSMNCEPCVSPDGKRFFFLSTRPRPGQAQKPGWADQDIWVMDRNEKGWGEPYNLGAPVNTDLGEFYPSVTREGTLYFTRGKDGEDANAIYRARLVNGKYAEPERLPEVVIGDRNPYNACIAPDESFLVLCVPKSKENIGRADYYVSFRSVDDRWSPPLNLGSLFNSPGDLAISPYVTPDGKYFFFGSSRKIVPPGRTTRDYRELHAERLRPGNGNCDLYWVEASAIEKLRPKEFAKK